MKKIIFIVLSLFIFSACSNGLISPMDRGDKIPKDQSVLIGKITLTPMIDEDGDETKDSDDYMLSVFLTIDDGNEILQEFDEVETNKFFAIPVSPSDSSKITELKFIISRKKWYSSTEHIYTTMLSQKHFKISESMKPGEIYSLGTININLNQKSFTEIDDEEYNDEVQYIIPNDISLDSNSDSASQWFKKEFPKSDRGVKKSGAQITGGTLNRFYETQITTTYTR